MKMFHPSHLLIYLSFVLSGFSLGAVADDDSGWQVSIGIGAGVRTNPIMDNSDLPLIVIPQINYQDERFFIQNLDLGYTLYNGESQQLHLLATPSYDQIFFKEWDASNFVVETRSFASAKFDTPTVEQENRNIDKSRLHKRRMAGLAGVEYGAQYGSIDFQIQALREVTGYYDGSEMRIAVSKNIESGKHSVKLTAGANWQSDRTINYFYGLDEHEAPDNMFEASSGISTLLRFDWNYQLTEHWSLRLLTSFKHLGDQISRSPLTTDNNVITAFAGGVYHF